MNYNASLLIADFLLTALMTAFTFFAWRSNKEFPGIREWFFAFACAAANMVFFIAGPALSRTLSSVILETLLMFTGIFCHAGCSRYAGRDRINYRIPVIILIGSLFVSGYFSETLGNGQVGFIVSSLMTGGFCIAAARILWRNNFSAQPVRHGLALGVFAHGVFMTLRPLLFSQPLAGFIEAGLSISSLDFIIFQQIIATPVLGLSVLLLINEHNAALLKVLAEYDSLTQARNRGSFLICLQKAASLSSRLRSPLAILTIDLDRFKLINDEFGHHAGDAILKSFARIAKSCLRQEDELGRIGGEEFAIFLVNTSVEQALPIAERIRASVEATPVWVDGNVVRYSASIGVASYDETLGIDKSLVYADRALYAAKHKGRNRVELALAG